MQRCRSHLSQGSVLGVDGVPEDRIRKHYLRQRLFGSAHLAIASSPPLGTSPADGPSTSFSLTAYEHKILNMSSQGLKKWDAGRQKELSWLLALPA